MLASRHNSHIFDEGVYKSHCKGELNGRRRGIRTDMPRSCVLVHGLHGAGKTTLLNALLGNHYFPYFMQLKNKCTTQKEETLGDVAQMSMDHQPPDDAMADEEKKKPISIFDIRERPSVSWTDIPVNILLHFDKDNHQKVLSFGVTPFLGSPSSLRMSQVQLKLWRDSFAPNSDDAPLPAPAFTIPYTPPSPLVAPSSGDDGFDYVMNDAEEQFANSERGLVSRQHAMQCCGVVDAMEDTVSKMLRVPHFITAECCVGGSNDKAVTSTPGEEAPADTTTTTTHSSSTSSFDMLVDTPTPPPAIPDDFDNVSTASAGDISNCSWTSSSSATASTPAVGVELDSVSSEPAAPMAAATPTIGQQPTTKKHDKSLFKMTFVEGQEITDRPPMHRVHSVLYVLDEVELMKNSSTEFRSSVHTSAKAAMTCDGTRCQAYLVVNRRTKEYNDLTNQQAAKKTISAEEYSRLYRVPSDNIFILDLRAALATSLLPGGAECLQRTPRGVGLELQRLQKVLASNHVRNVTEMKKEQQDLQMQQKQPAPLPPTTVDQPNSALNDNDEVSPITAHTATAECSAMMVMPPPPVMMPQAEQTQQRPSSAAQPNIPTLKLRLSSESGVTTSTTTTAATSTAIDEMSEKAPYVPVVCRKSFQQEAMTTMVEAADALEASPETCAKQQQTEVYVTAAACQKDTYRPKVFDQGTGTSPVTRTETVSVGTVAGTANGSTFTSTASTSTGTTMTTSAIGTSTNNVEVSDAATGTTHQATVSTGTTTTTTTSYVPRVLRQDSTHEQDAVERFEAKNSYVPKILRKDFDDDHV